MAIYNLVQMLAAALACYLLWRLWKIIDQIDRRAGLVVGVGLLLRVVAGLGAFWISYLRLPILRHLQLGEGFWFYAQDGRTLFNAAASVSRGGFTDIFYFSRQLSAAAFVKLLSIFVLFFGRVGSVGFLLNLFAFLVVAILIARWGETSRGLSAGGLLSLLAISFSPSFLLWSTQPLKDTVFVSMTVVFVAAVAGLLALFRQGNPSLLSWSKLNSLIVCTVSLLFSSWMLASIRSYFAFLLLGVCAVVLLGTALRSGRNRVLRVLLFGVVILVISRVVIYGGGSRVNQTLRAIVDVKRWIRTETRPDVSAPSLAGAVSSARGGFERVAASTIIRRGEAIARMEERLAGPPANYRDRLAARMGLPRTSAGRFVAGFSAAVVPRFIGMPEIFIIRGGRGLWALPEIDTIYFDAVLVAALAMLLATPLRRWKDGALMQVVLSVILVGIPLVYVVTNFGTLFRLRGIVFTLIALVPVALAAGDSDQVTPSPPPSSSP